MSWRRQIAKLRSLFWRRKPADDLAEEIRSHLEMEEQENLESGMPADEAHYAALRRFGNVALAQERSREMWRWNSLEALWQDLRFGARQLLRNPGFTVVAVLTLALGIGANAAVFSVTRAVLFRPLPFRDPGRLVLVVDRNLSAGYPQFSSSLANVMDWKAQSRAFEDLAVFATASLNLAGKGEPERLSTLRVSSNLMPLLGVRPVIGRGFLPAEDQPGGGHVALLGYGLWLRRFGSDPSVVGQSIQLDGQSTTVIGVLPGETQMETALGCFASGSSQRLDLIVPLAADLVRPDRGNRFPDHARTVEAWGVAAGCTGGHGCHHVAAGESVSSPQRRVGCQRIVVARSHRGRPAAAAAGSARRRGIRAADRLRKRL